MNPFAKEISELIEGSTLEVFHAIRSQPLSKSCVWPDRVRVGEKLAPIVARERPPRWAFVSLALVRSSSGGSVRTRG